MAVGLPATRQPLRQPRDYLFQAQATVIIDILTQSCLALVLRLLLYKKGVFPPLAVGLPATWQPLRQQKRRLCKTQA